jgi:hypothetical protein
LEENRRSGKLHVKHSTLFFLLALSLLLRRVNVLVDVKKLDNDLPNHLVTKPVAKHA